jgi:hypothetical protein
MAVARQREVAIDAVVPELLNVGVALVRDALAVAIDVNPSEGGRHHRVLGDLPDLVQFLVRRAEGAGGFVIGVVNGNLMQHARFERQRSAEHLHVSEGHHHAQLGW